jgi:hypothetical protein
MFVDEEVSREVDDLERADEEEAQDGAQDGGEYMDIDRS